MRATIPGVVGVLLVAAAGTSGLFYKHGWEDPTVAYLAALLFGLVVIAALCVISRTCREPDDFSTLTAGIYFALFPFQFAVACSCFPEPERFYAAPAMAYLCISFTANMLALRLHPRMRPLWFRLLFSYPSTASFCASIFGFLLFPAAWLPYPGDVLVAVALPHLLGLTGVVQSLLPVPSRWDVVKIEAGPGCQPVASDTPVRMPAAAVGTSCLRIVQLTDMHLGAFMPEERLQEICQLAVSHNPDIILLTGDYHTPESDHTPGSLLRALEPLRGFEHCYASLGNHDVESQEVYVGVRDAMQDLGISLLVDGDHTVTVRGRQVRIVGHGWPHRVKGAMRHMAPPNDSVITIHLLHSPAQFHTIPDTGALVLGGHTHGGQVGLLSLGLNATMVGLVTGHPDHSLWGYGRNRLWAHRGQGFRSLSSQWVPRLGVPPEYSVLALTWRGGSEGGLGAETASSE